MTIQFLVLVSVIGLASTFVVQAQVVTVPSESPSESASSAKKHREHKSAQPAATPAAPAVAESPAASPIARAPRKKPNTEATPSPAASPTASPKFRLGDLFKPKSSVSASPSAARVVGNNASGAAATTVVATATPAPGGGHGLVWVNTETHLYHKEGSRFYGTTKKGKYVSEADALKEGDRAAARGQ